MSLFEHNSIHTDTEALFQSSVSEEVFTLPSSHLQLKLTNQTLCLQRFDRHQVTKSEKTILLRHLVAYEITKNTLRFILPAAPETDLLNLNFFLFKEEEIPTIVNFKKALEKKLLAL